MVRDFNSSYPRDVVYEKSIYCFSRTGSSSILINSDKMERNSDKPKTLKELIKRSNLRQWQLSKEIGCSQSLVSQYVRGATMPTFDKAIAMSRVLGVSLKVLALSLGLDVSEVPDDGKVDESADPW